MIAIRRAETEADLERCVRIFNAVHAEDRIALQDFRSRAEHLRGAYVVEVECMPDVPATTPMAALPFERWHELIADHAVTFVALDGGRAVGYAALEHLLGYAERLGSIVVEREL